MASGKLSPEHQSQFELLTGQTFGIGPERKLVPCLLLNSRPQGTWGPGTAACDTGGCCRFFVTMIMACVVATLFLRTNLHPDSVTAGKQVWQQ